MRKLGIVNACPLLKDGRIRYFSYCMDCDYHYGNMCLHTKCQICGKSIHEKKDGKYCVSCNTDMSNLGRDKMK